jgi:hypothetical protein
MQGVVQGGCGGGGPPPVVVWCWVIHTVHAPFNRTVRYRVDAADPDAAWKMDLAVYEVVKGTCSG